MPEESGTWNERGQMKPVGWPGRSRRQCGRFRCHGRGRGIGEGYSFWLGDEIVNLNPFLASSGQKKFIFIFFFCLKPIF